MSPKPEVILSGFADEAANNKLAVEQFAAFAALGLHYYTIRFIDAGEGVKNVMQLSDQEIATIKQLQEEYHLSVSSLGSPIGKVKLLDVDDGSSNKYIPFETYLAEDVHRACRLSQEFGTRLIRGFSFYHPRGTDPRAHLSQVVDQLGKIADVCQQHDLTFGLEVEANLVGQDGYLLAEIHQQVNHPRLVLIFDAGNLVSQGMTCHEVFQHYQAMKPGLGWLHIKDYRHPPGEIRRVDHVDEAALKNFVPADLGDSGHEAILRDLRDEIPAIQERLAPHGIPGVFLDLEPHVKGGGQFGGFSGPDGLGVALRGLCNTLDYVGLGYRLRDFDDILRVR